MKKLCIVLSLLLFLTGCTGQTAPVPEETDPPASTQHTEEPAAQQTTVQQTEPETTDTPEVPPEPLPVPETPEPEATSADLPDLPLPVYCYKDTAVGSDGTVLLQLAEHRLEVMTDTDGVPRGILDFFDGQLTALYDLSGSLLLDNLSGITWNCTGDLFWYGGPGNVALVRLSDKTILQKNLGSVHAAGSHVFLQPAYWNSPCVILDSTGNEIRTLDRGFRIDFSYPDVSGNYVVMEARDGTEMLVDADGNPCLPDFCDQVLAVNLGCATILQDQEYQLVNLATQAVLFRYDRPFTWLGSTILTAEQDDSVILMDLQGSILLNATLCTVADPDGNGVADYLVCSIPEGNRFLTQIYTIDGALLQTLDCNFYDVTPLTDTLLMQAKPYGSSPQQQGWIVDLRNGTETRLHSGTALNAQPIVTTQGLLILVGSEERYVLMQPDRTEVFRCDRCTYVGGDVFRCSNDGQEGLMMLNGSWLLTRP